MEHKKSCNCCDCIWQRLIENQETVFTLKGGKNVSYKIVGQYVAWISMENTQRILFRQKRLSICNSIPARQNNLGPSMYPGTATSYKWALLNDSRIWLS
jgi:hypothetical protein